MVLVCAALQLYWINGFLPQAALVSSFLKAQILSLCSLLSPILHSQFLDPVGHFLVLLVHLPGQLFVDLRILFDNFRNRLQRGVRLRLQLGRNLAAVVGADFDGVIVPIDVHHPIAIQAILNASSCLRLLLIACGGCRLPRTRFGTTFCVFVRFATGGIAIEVLIIPMVRLLAARWMAMRMMLLLLLLMVMWVRVMIHAWMNA